MQTTREHRSATPTPAKSKKSTDKNSKPNRNPATFSTSGIPSLQTRNESDPIYAEATKTRHQPTQEKKAGTKPTTHDPSSPDLTPNQQKQRKETRPGSELHLDREDKGRKGSAEKNQNPPPDRGGSGFSRGSTTRCRRRTSRTREREREWEMAGEAWMRIYIGELERERVKIESWNANEMREPLNLRIFFFLQRMELFPPPPEREREEW